MMHRCQHIAQVGENQLGIEVLNRLSRPYALQSSSNRAGVRVYQGLPRHYQTLEEAKAAANLLAGVDLVWQSAESK